MSGIAGPRFEPALRRLFEKGLPCACFSHIELFWIARRGSDRKAWRKRGHDQTRVRIPLGHQEQEHSGFTLSGALPHHRSCAPSRSGDRKSTRLNSSHQIISYAVFCLKKKKKGTQSS